MLTQKKEEKNNRSRQIQGKEKSPLIVVYMRKKNERKIIEN